MARRRWIEAVLHGLDGASALLLPRCCVVCGKTPLARADRGVCPRCLGMLPSPLSRPCARCGAALPPGHEGKGRCPRCEDKPAHVRSVRASYRYEEGIREWIHIFKFRPEPCLARILGPLTARSLVHFPLAPRPELVVPVPLHPVRRRSRGFNQAERLARYVADAVRMPLERAVLRRVRNTPSQVGQGIHERQRNMRGAFRCQRASRVRGRCVVLVDDVLTTGATLSGAARALRMAGARSVHAAVLARVDAPRTEMEPWTRSGI